MVQPRNIKRVKLSPSYPVTKLQARRTFNPVMALWPHTSITVLQVRYIVFDGVDLNTITVGNTDRANSNDATSRCQPSQPAPSRSDPAPSQHSLPTQQPENVVMIHCRRNCAPRLPSNSQLLAIRQQQAGSANHATGEAANNDNGQDRPTDLPVGLVTERSEPWQLQYYDPPTWDVIEHVKQFSHCDAASIEPFPVRAAFNTKAIEYINESIAERRARGLIVSDGKLLHFDHSPYSN